VNYHILAKDELDGFIKKLSKKMKVCAPVKKGHGNFAFEEIASAGEIALSYIPTILPPKKYFMPPREKLLDFDISGEKPKDAANPRRLFVGATLRPAVERIVARAERERSAGRNIDGRLLPNLRFAAINIFRRWGERLGEPRLTGRTLRHSYVTAVLLLGGSAYDARVLAGHRNLKTTDRYVGELEGRRPIVDVIDAALAGSHAQGTEAVAP